MFENTSVSWLEDRHIMDVKLFGKSTHPYSLLVWLELDIDWTIVILQKVWYLSEINQSPSNQSAIAEIMRISLQTGQETTTNSVVVTYDWAIAKIAMQIPNRYIALCSFHTEMALFKALGKIISKSEGPFLLPECQVSFTSVTISMNDWLKFLKH